MEAAGFTKGRFVPVSVLRVQVAPIAPRMAHEGGLDVFRRKRFVHGSRDVKLSKRELWLRNTIDVRHGG